MKQPRPRGASTAAGARANDSTLRSTAAASIGSGAPGERFHAPSLFALALFGYPLVAAVVSFLQIDSRLLSVPFRLFVAGVAVALLLRSRSPRAGGARTVLLLVWSAYALRLLYDGFVNRIEGADYALLFFASGAMLPALALLAHARWHQQRYAWESLALAAGACAAILLGSRLEQFGDDDLTELAGRLTTVALNPTSLGHLAVSAVLCAVVLWRTVGLKGRVLLIAVMALALLTLLSTGSKAPAIAFGVCLLAWSMRRASARWPILLLALPAAAVVTLTGDNPLAERVAVSADDLGTLDRLLLVRNSLAQIEAAPTFGSAFVELQTGAYPHNIALEAALAFGVPFASVFIALLLYGLWLAWRALASDDEDLLGLLYLQAMIEAAVSGAMFGATLLWVTLALLLRPRGMRRRRTSPRWQQAGAPGATT